MSVRRPTFWLSMHVPYACRHAGACCASGWPIPIEAVRVAAVASLRPAAEWLRPMAGAPADVAGALRLAPDGHCVFHRAGCEIQHAFGPAALPSACQHFPRVVLLDARGIFVSLSHYCPTAVDLLFTHRGAVRIVEGPPALACGEPEGLDARDVLPPLLVGGRREAVLMDLEGYSAWEAHLVDVLTTGHGPAEEALEALGRQLNVLQSWRPGKGSLAQAVRTMAGSEVAGSEVAVPGSEVAIPGSELVIRRYLAARGFAAWAAYQRGGPSGVLAELEEALRLVRIHTGRLGLREAIRQADLRLLHSDS